MIDYYEKVDFSEPVFIVQEDKVKTVVLGKLCREHAEITTTPHGISPVLHTRCNELWTWGHQGNYPKKIMEFESVQDAEHALLLSFQYDLFQREGSPWVHFDRESAENELSELLSQDED